MNNSFLIVENLAESRKSYPYLINVQSEVLSELNTRLVIPLCNKKNINKEIKILNPIIEINSVEYICLTQQMASIQMKYLGKVILEIDDLRSEILSAIDFSITGF